MVPSIFFLYEYKSHPLPQRVPSSLEPPPDQRLALQSDSASTLSLSLTLTPNSKSWALHSPLHVPTAQLTA